MNTQNTLRMTLVALAVASVTMMVGVTHAAEAGDDVPKAAVSYKDLNLNTDDGVKVLYKRIQRAANQVCGNVDGRELKRMSVKQACVERAVADAVAAVNTPMLVKTAALAQVR